MAFTRGALDFLFENWSRNDRNWYHENRELYRKLLQEPFIALVQELQPTMLGIDPLMDCSEKRIARVYRDARMIGNGPYFRDHIWCTMGRGREIYWGYPAFFFEISVRGFSCGMGYYQPAKESLEEIRQLILEGDKDYQAARRADRKQKRFRLEGESYKRNHYPAAPEEDWDWLNRKALCWVWESQDFALLFSEELGAAVAEGFRSIAPIYAFLLKGERWRG